MLHYITSIISKLLTKKEAPDYSNLKVNAEGKLVKIEWSREVEAEL